MTFHIPRPVGSNEPTASEKPTPVTNSSAKILFMSAQPESEVALLKRKLWRIGVIADALEGKLSNPLLKEDRDLRDEIISGGLKELLAEITRPPGRQERGQPKKSRS